VSFKIISFTPYRHISTVHVDDSWSQKRIDEAIEYRRNLDKLHCLFRDHNATVASDCGVDEKEVYRLSRLLDDYDVKYPY
jgi:hypothetical protein